MNSCMNEEVRDALPDLMHGRLSDLDKVTMRAHVETCADCREELRLLEKIRASAPIAPRIDVSRIVAALPAPMPGAADQLTPSAPARRGRRSSMLLKMTAAAALLVAGSLTFANARRQTAAPSSVSATAAPAISAQAVTSAETLVAAAPVTLAGPGVNSRNASRTTAGLSLTGGVQDLSDDQLESLVNGLDNVEAIPSVEPEPITLSVEEDGLQ